MGICFSSDSILASTPTNLASTASNLSYMRFSTESILVLTASNFAFIVFSRCPTSSFTTALTLDSSVGISNPFHPTGNLLNHLLGAYHRSRMLAPYLTSLINYRGGLRIHPEVGSEDRSHRAAMF